MVIKFSDTEQEIIQAYITMKVTDSEPCTKCSAEDRRSCEGCLDQINWTHKNKSLLDKFDALKNANPAVDFDAIIAAVLKLIHSEALMEDARRKHQVAYREMQDLTETIENPDFLSPETFLHKNK